VTKARLSIFSYIETFYNPKGAHTSLGGISPTGTSVVVETDYREKDLIQ
jgi:hypothetical protein